MAELQSREAMEATHIAMVLSGFALVSQFRTVVLQAQIEMPRLAEVLAEEKEQRDAMQQRYTAAVPIAADWSMNGCRLTMKLTEEIRRLEEAILAEKKAREETEEAMLRMLEDVVTRLQDEVQVSVVLVATPQVYI